MRKTTELMALGMIFSGLSRFTGRGADELNRSVGEEHALHEDDHRQNAVGEDPAVVREEAEADLLAGVPGCRR